MTWKPGQQKARREMEDPFEGVPRHLGPHLWEWIEDGVWGPHGMNASRLSAVAMALRVPLTDGTSRQKLDHLRIMCNDPSFMLDTVEVLLDLWGTDGTRAKILARMLDAANSAYTVNDAKDGLEEIVPSGVKAAVVGAASAAEGSAGDHLVEAWNGAYGRTPDPVKSYSEAIKAAEAALAPIVSPQNLKQTLGTMIRDVAAKPSKWQFVIADGSPSGVETVLSMMRLLWDGQTSRHGGMAPTRTETPEEARAAVHLAAALVQFGASGAFRLSQDAA